ncbi:hypothetical protein J4434_03405 [Candidatus Woesearchaeota archaeon]|nr:hypothetical protein [Candidatus Woesearchaeota archaeon]
MTSVAKQVWKAIEEDIVIRRSMEKKIVNIRALAVYIIKEHKLPATIDAVITAIRRYKEDGPLEKKYEEAKKIISLSEDVRLTSNIISIAIEKNKKTQEILQKVFSLIDYEKGQLLVIIQGEGSIKIMINKKNEKKILSCIDQKSIIKIEGNLAQINIQLSEVAVKTPGIITVLSTELMMHNINVVEVMSCVPEMFFFVKQKDVVKAYELLFNLCGI